LPVRHCGAEKHPKVSPICGIPVVKRYANLVAQCKNAFTTVQERKMVGMTRRQIKSSLTPLIALVIGAFFSIASFSVLACGLRDNGATFFDSRSGLTIQKCPVGSKWNAGKCEGTVKELNWDDAVSIYRSGEWRLITNEEAELVVKSSIGCKLKNGTWTSHLIPWPPGWNPQNNPFAIQSGAYVFFDDGYVTHNARNFNGGVVRLVSNNPSSAVASVANMGNQRQVNSNDANRNSADLQNLNISNTANHPSNAAHRQQLQAAATQAQTRAREAQQRGDTDAQRKGRRTHDPAAEAHECIEVDTTSLYGGFKNKCSFPVSYGYCVENPKSGAWTDSPLFSCAGMQGKSTAGGGSMGPNGYDANHTKGGTAVHYFACRRPAGAYELTFDGSQIVGRCRTIGG
jgi:hypothetical protein